MTLIVANGHSMVGDTMETMGARRMFGTRQKIVRLPGGGLVGCCGCADDCFVFSEWAARGFLAEAFPSLSDDDSFRALHLAPDGALRMFYGAHRSHPLEAPALIGESTAVNVAAGALAVGATIEMAVQAAIDHTVWVGGPVQVEKLYGP